MKELYMERNRIAEYISKLPYSPSIKNRLVRYLEKLQNVKSLSMVVLFGSYARMEQRAGSDLDILAITETEVPREVRGQLCSWFEENEADLIFYTRKQFEESDCRLVREVRKDGILLWKK